MSQWHPQLALHNRTAADLKLQPARLLHHCQAAGGAICQCRCRLAVPAQHLPLGLAGTQLTRHTQDRQCRLETLNPKPTSSLTDSRSPNASLRRACTPASSSLTAATLADPSSMLLVVLAADSSNSLRALRFLSGSDRSRWMGSCSCVSSNQVD